MQPKHEGERPMSRGKLLIVIQVVQLVALSFWIFATTHSRDGWFFGQWAIVLGITGLQWALLAPVLRPVIRTGKQQHWSIWASAVVAGLVFGCVVFGCLGLMRDGLFLADLLPSQMRMHPDVDDHETMAVLAFAVACWIWATPFVVAFMRRGPTNGQLKRIATRLFGGTVIEAVASIPLLRMLKQRDSCVCATFTAYSIFISTVAGLVVLGPIIFLVILGRRRRYTSDLCGACGAAHPMHETEPCPVCGTGWKTNSIASG